MIRPIIVLTAGDVAGIGPEVALRAAVDQRVRAVCRPLVFCHPQILDQACQLVALSSGPPVQIVEHTVTSRQLLEQQLDSLSAHEVLCCNPAGEDVPDYSIGEVSAGAGDAAYRYLVAATELAKSEVVDAIATLRTQRPVGTVVGLAVREQAKAARIARKIDESIAVIVDVCECEESGLYSAQA